MPSRYSQKVLRATVREFNLYRKTLQVADCHKETDKGHKSLDQSNCIAVRPYCLDALCLGQLNHTLFALFIGIVAVSDLPELFTIQYQLQITLGIRTFDI